MNIDELASSNDPEDLRKLLLHLGVNPDTTGLPAYPLPGENIEEWRAVLHYEGLYEVSSFGIVRSLDRYDARGRFWAGRAVSHYETGSAKHLQVKLMKDSVQRSHMLRRIVLEAFRGPAPAEDYVATFGYKGPDDYTIWNLFWRHCPRISAKLQSPAAGKRGKTGTGKNHAYTDPSSPLYGKHKRPQRRKRNSERGVYYDKNAKKWRAYIYVKEEKLKSFVPGCYCTRWEAMQARSEYIARLSSDTALLSEQLTQKMTGSEEGAGSLSSAELQQWIDDASQG